MALTLPYPTLGTGIADSTKIDSNFSNVTAKFNQGIVNADINASAAIAQSKLAPSYEYYTISARLDMAVAASEATDVYIPLYNDGNGDWTAVAYQWATPDTGDPSAVVKIDWGVLNGAAAPGAFTVTTALATITMAGINIATQSGAALGTVLAFGGAGVYRSLRFYVSTADNPDAGVLNISLLLKRATKSS